MAALSESSSDDEVLTFTTIGGDATLLRLAAESSADVLQQSLNASMPPACVSAHNPQLEQQHDAGAAGAALDTPPQTIHTQSNHSTLFLST